MSIEAMKHALEALEVGLDYAKGEQFENAQRFKGYEHLAPDDADSIAQIENAITSLRQAIAEAEKQEPLAWFRYETFYEYRNQLARCTKDCIGAFPVYTSPPKREWQGLTDEELHAVIRSGEYDSMEDFARAIEAKLKAKNGFPQTEKNT